MFIYSISCSKSYIFSLNHTINNVFIYEFKVLKIERLFVSINIIDKIFNEL